MDPLYSVEELVADVSFLAYCEGMDPLAVNRWEEYLVLHPGQKEVVAEARRFVLALRSMLEEAEAARAWNEFDESLIRRKSAIVRPAKSPFRWWKWAGAAAAIVVITVSFYFYQYKTNHYKGEYRVYTCKAGERQNVYLPDSTRVILNGATTVRITEAFGKENREVLLMGDAYFDVAQNTETQFSVVADGFAVTALGTAFRVKSEGAREVKLLHGKVLVERPDHHQKIVLLPSQMLTSGKGKLEWTAENFDITRLEQWVNGELTFRNAGLKEVVSTLEEWYGVDLEVIKTPAREIRFNGDFRNQPLDKVLEVFTFSTGSETSSTIIRRKF